MANAKVLLSKTDYWVAMFDESLNVRTRELANIRQFNEKCWLSAMH